MPTPVPALGCGGPFQAGRLIQAGRLNDLLAVLVLAPALPVIDSAAREHSPSDFDHLRMR